MNIGFTSWRQPKFARTMDHSRQDGDERLQSMSMKHVDRDKTRKIHGRILSRKVWKEKTISYNRQRNHWPQTEKEGRMDELENYSDSWVRSAVKKRTLFRSKRASPKKNSNNALKSIGHPGSLLRKRQNLSHQAWQVSQSSNTKCQNLEQDLEGV